VRSPKCRKCWSEDKVSLSKVGSAHGFKKGYRPWNKGTIGLTRWSEGRRRKIMAYMKNGGGMKGKKHSLETRKKIGGYHLKEKNKNWKGGVACLNKKKWRQTFEWRIWKDACFKRDDYTCRWCGKRGGRLVVHHIKRWSEFTKLRTEMMNGITLCKSCHRKTHFKEEIYEDFFKKLLGQSVKKNRVNSGNTLQK